MAALVAALLLGQMPGLLGDDDDVPPPVQPQPPPSDAPLVIPPADGPVPPGVPVPDPVPAAVAKKAPLTDETRRLLIGERQTLVDTMPNYVLPTAVVVAGAVGLIVGGLITVLSAKTAFSVDPRANNRDFIIGLSVGILGLSGCVLGLIWERERALTRDGLFERIEEIERELGW